MGRNLPRIINFCQEVSGRQYGSKKSVKWAVGGRCVELKHHKGATMEPREKYKPREIVKTFSRQSRNNLLKMLLSIDYDAMGPPVFFTLTYPGEYSEDPKSWKRDFHSWVTRIAYKHPELCLIWRLEPQKRGAPHFSGFLWGWDELSTSEGREELSRTWYEVVGSGDKKHLRAGTQAILVSGPDRRRQIFYLAKYQSKDKTGNKEEFFPYPVGRYWGVCGKRNLKIIKEVADLPAPIWYKVRRAMRKALEKKTHICRKSPLGQSENGLWLEMSEKDLFRLLDLYEEDA